MPDDDIKPPGNIAQWVFLIIAIIAIIITIYQFYLRTKKECTTDEDCETGEVCEDGTCVPDVTPPPPECVIDADCPPNNRCIGGFCIPDDPGIPGNPDFWAIDETFPPTKQFIYNLPQVAHVSTLTGAFHLVNTCPGCWFLSGAGVRIFAHQTTGHRIEIYRNYPINGLREGWHSFSTSPGLNNVTKIEFIIDRWFGFGDRAYRLDAIQGELVVFV